MAEAVVAYDRVLPEIPDRRPWEPPDSYLVKDDDTPSGWRVNDSGRRPSPLLLAPKIRKAVNDWRDSGYEGASEVTQRLFAYWFDEDHEVDGFDAPFRYHFCQREAIETLVWLVEIFGQSDTKALLQEYASISQMDLISQSVDFQTAMDGRRQIRRYVSERDQVGVQDLPPENLRRLAFKMATGAGKTWVMAMAVVWFRFHRQRVPDSDLSTNFLIVAPNVIVYQRLEKDFADNRIFHSLPLIPPEWMGEFSQKVILRDDAAEPNQSGNLFLTNVHQLYESRGRPWEPTNAIDNLLGPKPTKDLSASGRRSLLDRVQSLPDLVVLNDEAHHVHDEDLAWSRSLLAIHDTLPKGLAAWLDFSATPKDQNGMFFPWTVVDYPLAQAVEDRIVKAPIIVTNAADGRQPAEDPDGITGANAAEKYGFWLEAAVQRWKEHREAYRKLRIRPVLFVMAEKNAHADAIGEHLRSTPEYGFKGSEVLIIHTDNTGEVRKGDLARARQAARDIDHPDSRIKVIVSVMMLREGWDVRNVSVVLGLRPFTARAEILPEQVIGRGLRPMTGVSPDRTQTLEVLGTRNLLQVLREQLEAEGVSSASTAPPPPSPVVIQPVQERLEFDIAIPITKPSLRFDLPRLSRLDVTTLEALCDQEELAEPYRNRLVMEFATTKTTVHHHAVPTTLRPSKELLAKTVNLVAKSAGLTNCFADLYPVVRDYVANRCFGQHVNLEDEIVRSHLAQLEMREGIARYLARKIAEITIEQREIEFERADFCLSQTKPFSWRRNLPLLAARKTVFNYVATFNGYERSFAEFLDRATDVPRFAALGTTEQGSSGTTFRVDYLKTSGAIGFYYPDWVAVQRTDGGAEINWIIETKGRVWEGTREKDSAIREWCLRVSAATGASWRYVRVNQSEFDSGAATLGQLITTPESAPVFT